MLDDPATLDGMMVIGARGWVELDAAGAAATLAESQTAGQLVRAAAPPPVFVCRRASSKQRADSEDWQSWSGLTSVLMNVILLLMSRQVGRGGRR